MRSYWLFGLAVLFMLTLLACWAGLRSHGEPPPRIGSQSSETAILDPATMAEWTGRELSKKRPVEYQVVHESRRSFLRARSDDAASMWIRHLEFDPADYPWVEWEWRVNRAVEGESLDRKEANDCSARILFGFKGDWSKSNFFEQQAVANEIAKTGHEPPGRLLVYVFSLEGVPESIVSDPHLGDRARILVASSGKDRLAKWQSVRRNLVEDFRRAFGSDPPPVISVALMTDTDDTHSAAEADYGRILLRKR